MSKTRKTARGLAAPFSGVVSAMLPLHSLSRCLKYRRKVIASVFVLAGTPLAFPAYGEDFTSTVNGDFTFTEDSKITTAADSAYGMYTTNGTRIISDFDLSVSTQGQGAGGIFLRNGTISLVNGEVTTTGNYASGIAASNLVAFRSTMSSTGDMRISTAGDYASGVRSAQNGYIQLNNVDVSTTGYGSSALYATGSSAITVTGTTRIRTSGDYSTGVYSSDSSFSAQRGTISLGSADITTTGTGSGGVVLDGISSVINLNGGDIRTQGSQSHGVMVLEGAQKRFDGQEGNILPSIMVSGDGSAALASAGTGSKLTLSGNTGLTMGSAAGVNTWGGLATDGGALIFEGGSSSGGSRLWVTDERSSLTLSENADAAGSLVRLDDGTLYMGSHSQAGALTGTAGAVLQAMTPGGSVTLGNNNATNNGSLVDQANFAGRLRDISVLIKAGTLTQVLSGTDNIVGSVQVTGGALRFEQAGAFSTTGDYRTQTGATTAIGHADASLVVGGTLFQDPGSSLFITPGAMPDITAGMASLNGQVVIDGFSSGPVPVKASDINGNTYTVIHTARGITGDFINNPLASTGLDYLLQDGHITPDGKDYRLGFRLAWNEGLHDKGTGNYTLNAGTAFDVDTVLKDQTEPSGGFTRGWDGRSLTKAGEGLLLLSAVNTYSGSTTINAGILQTGVADSIASSHALIIQGGVFDLDGNPQRVNRLSGAGGDILLNGAALTADNATLADSTLFAGHIIDGTITGGTFSKTGDGSLTLTGKTLWTGNTRIDGGNLVLDGSAGGAQLASSITGQGNTVLSLRHGATLTGSIYLTDISIDDNGIWNMTANSLVDKMNLAGKVAFTAPAGHILTATSWNGQEGIVVLNTVLGNDSAVTDKIVINGNSQGNTQIKINNAGGRGAQTQEGIRIVEVHGMSEGTFTQAERIVAGAFDYHLVKKRDDWFLISAVQPDRPPLQPGEILPQQPGMSAPAAAGKSVPILRPEGGSYSANLVAANTLFVTRLHDRPEERLYTDVRTGETQVTRLWLRQAGGHQNIRDSSGQLNTQSNRFVTQLGGEVAQWSPDGLQRLHLGVMAGYGNNRSRSRSDMTGYESRGAMDGYSAGLYATWYQNRETKEGLYVDSQALYSWFDNEVKAEDVEAERYQSDGITASLESGYTHKLTGLTGGEESRNAWYIQPQAQAIWMGVQADEHWEANGTRISGEGPGNLQTRLGSRMFLKNQRQADADMGMSFQPFVEVNWIHNTRDFGTRMDGISVREEGTRNIGEVKTGLEGQLSQHLNLWGNVGVQVGNEGYNDVSAIVGAKYHF